MFRQLLDNFWTTVRRRAAPSSDVLPAGSGGGGACAGEVQAHKALRDGVVLPEPHEVRVHPNAASDQLGYELRDAGAAAPDDVARVASRRKGLGEDVAVELPLVLPGLVARVQRLAVEPRHAAGADEGALRARDGAVREEALQGLVDLLPEGAGVVRHQEERGGGPGLPLEPPDEAPEGAHRLPRAHLRETRRDAPAPEVLPLVRPAHVQREHRAPLVQRRQARGGNELPRALLEGLIRPEGDAEQQGPEHGEALSVLEAGAGPAQETLHGFALEHRGPAEVVGHGSLGEQLVPEPLGLLQEPGAVHGHLEAQPACVREALRWLAHEPALVGLLAAGEGLEVAALHPEPALGASAKASRVDEGGVVPHHRLAAEEAEQELVAHVPQCRSHAPVYVHLRGDEAGDPGGLCAPLRRELHPLVVLAEDALRLAGPPQLQVGGQLQHRHVEGAMPRGPHPPSDGQRPDLRAVSPRALPARSPEIGVVDGAVRRRSRVQPSAPGAEEEECEDAEERRRQGRRQELGRGHRRLEPPPRGERRRGGAWGLLRRRWGHELRRCS
mmetsp:Transcript_49211/g.154613  ORF Transcript_49211/g.154613 Transcript_49211/m.154613 type:complete len:556 (+) Transcript_49211:9-1676(+)